MKSTSRQSKPLLQILTLTFVAILLFPLSPAVFAQSYPVSSDTKSDGALDGPKPIWVEGQIVVKFSAWADIDEIMTSMANYEVVAYLDHSGTYLFETGPNLRAPVATTDLEGLWGVEWVHPNYLINRLHSVQGSYPFGDVQKLGSFPDADISEMLDLPASHEIVTGNGVTVAVIDCGVNIDHPELDGSVEYGYDFVDDDAIAFDELGGIASGHGTFVAGLINQVAPDALIRAYRVINQHGVGDGFTLARAIEKAVDDGCRVINISLVLQYQHLAVRDAIDYANRMGVTIVSAAGNNASNEPFYPAAESNALAVAALDSMALVANFSNFGDYIDVCAPATLLYSTYSGVDYAWWSGTSFSTPLVSGEAALMLAQTPLASPEQIRSAIRSSAIDADAANPDYAGGLGDGLINPLAALSLMANQATFDPDTLFFTHYEGATYIILPWSVSYLSSTNAPATWSAEILDLTAPFSVYVDSTGITDDSVWVLVDPSMALEGLYYNTVRYTVDGVAEPVDLTISLTVLPTNDTLDYALVSPSALYFTSPVGPEPAMLGSAYLSSTNAPADYTAEIVGGAGFTILGAVWGGQTNDSVYISVDPNMPFSPGLYADTVHYLVDGIDQPAVLVVYLELTDTTIVSDTGYVFPRTQSFVAPAGTDHVEQGMIFVGCSGGNYPYTINYWGTPDVVHLLDTVGGYANDSLVFEVHSPSSLNPGLYSDTLLIMIEGVNNNPLFAVVNLYVDSGGTGDNIATAWPYAQYFEVDGNVAFDLPGFVYLSTTDGPSAYTVSVVGNPTFVTFDSPSGMTEDSILFSVHSDIGYDSGIYIDTLVFDVEGADNSPVIAVVYLAVGGAGGGNGTITLTPGFQYFEAEEGVAFNQSGSVHVGYSMGTTEFFVEHVDVPDFVQLGDPNGLTNDTLFFTVASAVGLDSGLYVDTIAFYVDGADNTPAVAIVYLAVGGAGSGQGVITLSPIAEDFYANAYTPFSQPGSFYLTTSKEPYAFTVELVGNVDFTTLIDTVGVSDDSIRYTVSSVAGMAPGVYIDTVLFTVPGTSNSPKMGFLFLQVSDTVGSASCCEMVGDVNGNGITFEWADTLTLASILRGDEGILYLIDCLGNADIDQDCTIDAYDLDLMKIIILGDSIPFGDCATCETYTVVVTDTTGGSGPDSAWVAPYTQDFTAPSGVAHSQPGYIYVGTVNEPQIVWLVVVDELDFLYVPETFAPVYTNDSLFFTIASTASMAPGWYADTLQINVDGVTNSPLYAVVNLHIDTVGGGGSDSVWVTPMYIFAHSFPDNPTTQAFGLTVGSTGDPVAFSAFVLGGSSSFVSLMDSIGMTGDSIIVEVDPLGLSEGWYADTIIVDVVGQASSFLSIVTLQVSWFDSSSTDDIAVANLQNYPNPFNPTTTIAFSLNVAADVRLDIYNVLGRKVTTLTEGTLEPGEHSLQWDASRLASGVYFYRLTTSSGYAETRKMVLLK